ncbi:MAG: MATE family efflux transporter [Defluviitaleaceae bacterium]|nr:MATE family efflux transporter [Defluviitaleaceae bacterium]
METPQTSKELTPQEQKLATYGIPKLVLQYSIPTIIGMLVNALYVVVDRFFVGQIPDVSYQALTGIGLAAPILNIVGAFALLVGIGTAANISLRLGKRDTEGAERVLGNALLLNLTFPLVLGAIGLIFLEPLLIAVGATESTLPFALTYTRIILAGCILMFLSFAMNHPIRAMGNPKRFASAQLIGAISNIILSPIFILWLELGIMGAAISTLIAQSLSAIWVFAYYLTNVSGKPVVTIKLKNMKPSLKIILSIFAIGISPFFMQFLGSVINIVANRSLLYYGAIEFGYADHAVGAFTVILSISMLFLMPVFGINQGAQPILGFNYGAGNIARVKQAYKYSVIYAVAICVLGFIIVQLFAGQLMSLFSNDPALNEIGTVGMRIILFTMPFMGFQMNTANFFQSIGRAKISVFLAVLRQGLILIPAYLILPRIFGFHGIWFAMPVADTLALLITGGMIIREFKRLDKMMEEKISKESLDTSSQS